VKEKSAYIVRVEVNLVNFNVYWNYLKDYQNTPSKLPYSTIGFFMDSLNLAATSSSIF